MNNKIIGQSYPSECLRDSKTGEPIMITHTEDSEVIREMARKSAEELLELQKMSDSNSRLLWDVATITCLNAAGM